MMQFTFKRDEEGRERIYVGDVPMAEIKAHGSGAKYIENISNIAGSLADIDIIEDAIELADEAGFWISKGDAYYVTTQAWCKVWLRNDVTVDVPVAETSTTLTLVSEEGDET